MKLKNIIIIVLIIASMAISILCVYNQITTDTIIEAESETEEEFVSERTYDNIKIKSFASVYNVNYVNPEEVFADTTYTYIHQDSQKHYKTFFVTQEAELEFVKSKYGNTLGLSKVGANGLSVYDNLEKYYGTDDYEFFNENALILVYVPVNSNSYKTTVKGVYSDGTDFCTHIENTLEGDIGLSDMAGRFVVIEISLDDMKEVGKIDAIEAVTS